MRKEQRHIMYVCEGCLENAPEGCGHFDKDELRVAPNGEWMCDSCYDNHESMGIDWVVNWVDLPEPPEYVEKQEDEIERLRSILHSVHPQWEEIERKRERRMHDRQV